MPPTIRPTTSPTSPSTVLTLVTLELELKGDWCRLRAFGHPLHGVRKLHEWRFRPNQVTASLLDELGATLDTLGVSALLAALGTQLQMAIDLQGEVGALRAHLAD
jgi:hypothetical protein